MYEAEARQLTLLFQLSAGFCERYVNGAVGTGLVEQLLHCSTTRIMLPGLVADRARIAQLSKKLLKPPSSRKRLVAGDVHVMLRCRSGSRSPVLFGSSELMPDSVN